MSNVIEDFIELGESVKDIPIMVAVRDPLKDTYIYNNLDTTWTGYSLVEWNAMDIKQRFSHLEKDDLVECVGRYSLWKNSDSKAPLNLRYRAFPRDGGEIVQIRCKFLKLFMGDKMYIAEISFHEKYKSHLTPLLQQMIGSETILPYP